MSKFNYMKTKQCCICKEHKPHNEFYSSGRNQSGSPKYMSRCKKCDNSRIPSPDRKKSVQTWRRKKSEEGRLWMTELKRTLSCKKCGLSFKDQPWLLDFHHRDPSTKLFQVGCAPTYLKPRHVIEAEIAKCDPLCVNCHRTLHYSPFYKERML